MSVVALAGNPNCGKTSVFNRLTGLNQKVGNYPGVTVERRSGRAVIGGGPVEIVDLPGTYSLIAQSRDEAIAFEVLAGLGREAAPDLVVVVLDATNLLRNLYLALSILELGRPAVVALNMMDLARERGVRIDVEALSEGLGMPVVPIVARAGEGLDDLRAAIAGALLAPPPRAQRTWQVDPPLEALIARVRTALPEDHRDDGVAVWTLATVAANPSGAPDPTNTTNTTDPTDPTDRPWPLRLHPGGLASAGAPGATQGASGPAAMPPEPARPEGAPLRKGAEGGKRTNPLASSSSALSALPAPLAPAGQEALRGLEALDGVAAAQAIIEARYRRAREIVAAAERSPAEGAPTRTDRIDAVLLHPVAGILVFLATMAVVFQSIFAWAEPLMTLIEEGVGLVQGGVRSVLPEGALADLFADGVAGGVGNVVVFVPQIAFLFLFIALLEDSGYLARAAFISDRMMASVGLHGRAFVPLLSGFACAVPAIMASRTIESPRDRLVTILVTPLVSCSARLPVYTLLIATLFSSEETVLGIFSVGGLLMLAMYLLSFAVTVAVAFVLKRTLLKSPTPPLVLELPPYRMPEVTSVLGRVYDRCRVFVKDAGTIILACSMVLWALLYFPTEAPSSSSLEAQQAALQARTTGEGALNGSEAPGAPSLELEALEKEAEAARVQASVAGRLGRALEPVFEPLGYDWKMVISILASFAAREVFVSTLGLVYGIGDDADEESLSLREKLRREVDPVTGKPVYTPLVGLSLMVFFVIALQCMSTLAAIRRETGSWRWPAFAFAYTAVLAWLGAFTVYQGGRLLGFT